MLDLTQAYILPDCSSRNFKKIYHPSLTYGIRYIEINGTYYVTLGSILCNMFSRSKATVLQMQNRNRPIYNENCVYIDTDKHIYAVDEKRAPDHRMTICCSYESLFNLFKFIKVTGDVIDVNKYQRICSIVEYALKYEDELSNKEVPNRIMNVTTRNMAGSKELKYYNVFTKTELYLHYVIAHKRVWYSLASITRAMVGDSNTSNIKLTGITEMMVRILKGTLYYKSTKTKEICFMDIVNSLPRLIECKFFTDKEIKTLTDIKEQTIRFFKLEANGNVPDSFFSKEQAKIEPVKEAPSDDDALAAKVMAVIKAMKEQGVL